jgi:hypothetical protein
VIVLWFVTVFPEDVKVNVVVPLPHGRMLCIVTLNGVGWEIVVVAVPPLRNVVVNCSFKQSPTSLP